MVFGPGLTIFRRRLKTWSLQAAISQRRVAFASEGVFDRSVTLNCGFNFFKPLPQRLFK
jgi:hypothetical protein